MFKVLDKIAQAEQEHEFKDDEVRKSDYIKFNEHKLVERIKNMEKKINTIELIS